MKLCIILCSLSIAVVICYSDEKDEPFVHDEPFIHNEVSSSVALILAQKWQSHKLKYNLSFPKAEEQYRMKVYRDNLNFIHYFNEEEHSFKLAENQFAHWTHEEYVKWLGQRYTKKKYYVGESLKQQVGGDDLGDKDWRKLGAVSPVKTQGQCNAGYAFAANAVFESFRYRRKFFTSLSEQELVDCSGSYGNNGCDSGSLENALKYIRDEGIVPTAFYPYTEKKQTCQNSDKKYPYVFKFRQIVKVVREDEKELSSAVFNKGPVASSVDASQKTFMFYNCGVYHDPNCSNDPNHALLVIGIQGGKVPTYILKNSFGRNWGDNGVMYLARYKSNMCGIASDPMYVE